MKIRHLLLVLATGVVVTSCLEKGFFDSIQSKKNLNIPENFNWETTQNILCQVNVQAGEVGVDGNELYQVVRIYKSADLEEGSYLAGGSAKSDMPFKCSLTIPTALKTLHVEIIKPTGKRLVTAVEVKDGMLKMSEISTMSLRSTVARRPAPEITIPATYDVQIFGTNPVIIDSNKTYLIPAGETLSGKITAQGSVSPTVYVAGTYSGQDMILDKYNVVILPGGVVEIPKMDIISSKKLSVCKGGKLAIGNGAKANLSISAYANMLNVGTVTITGSLDIPSGGAENYGTLTVEESTNLLASSYLKNFADFTSKDANFAMQSSLVNDVAARVEILREMTMNTARIMNSGEMVIKKLEMNGGKIDNYCHLTFTSSATFTANASIVATTGSLTQVKDFLPSGFTLSLTGNSYFKFETLDKKTYNFKVTAPERGDFAIIKKTGESTIHDLSYAATTFSGRVEFVYGGLKEKGDNRFPASIFTRGAYITREQTKTLTETDCNRGEGEIEKDSDGDGVVDNLDQFPADKDRAYISYFPNIKTWATYAFEDSWPAMGDYDMNDIVIGAQLVWISNAQNKVVEMNVKTEIRAIGGSLPTAAAFQLDDVNATEISSAKGFINEKLFALNANGIESGVTKAIVPLFDNTEKMIHWDVVGPFGNTQQGSGVISSDTLTVKILFVTPIDQSKVGKSKFNLFIMAQTDKGQGVNRAHEIHLAEFTATQKAAIVNQDNLLKTNQYRTKDGMVWGIMVPEMFAYPVEKVHLKEAHLNFVDWANSAGSLFEDWYTDKSGYRDNDKIYRK